MARNSVQSYFRGAIRAFPLRFNAGLLALLAGAAYAWIKSRQDATAGNTEMPDSVTPLLVLLLQIAGLTLLCLVGLTLLLTLFAWAGLRLRKRKGTSPVALNFSTAPAGGLLLSARLEITPLPFWGTALLTVFFEEGGSAGPVLLERRGFSLLPAGRRKWESTGPLQLQRVQAYKVAGARLQLRDVFGLFALGVTLPASALAVNKPGSTGADMPPLPPSKTIDFEERIEELKPVEGELFQYKNFENGDDMRRIVWKVYARNRDLVVRTPERLEPYASHIDLWASFGAALPLPYDAQNQWVQELLSFYKEGIWGLYQSVRRQGLRPYFHSDQEVSLAGGEADGPEALVQSAITGAQWTAGDSLPAGAGRKGEVVVVSALISPDALSHLLGAGRGPSAVCLVTLSECIAPPKRPNILARIFLRPARTPENRLQTGWRKSPLRVLLQRRETELRALLEASGVKAIYL